MDESIYTDFETSIFSRTGQGEILSVLGNSDTDLKTFLEKFCGFLKLKGSKFSVLYKEPHLFQNLSVAENIFFPYFPRHKILKFINYKNIYRLVSEFLHELEFDLNPYDIVKNLSHEQRKLVSIAHAFNTDADTIIMEDPTDLLNPDMVKILYKIIRDFKANGKSIVYLTQQWEESLKISDKIVVFTAGEIKDVFNTNEVRKRPLELLDALGYCNYKSGNNSGASNTANELDAVLTAAELVTGEHELKDVLSLLCRQAADSMDANGSIIYLLDEVTNTVINSFEVKNDISLSATLKDEEVLKAAKANHIFYSSLNEKDYTLNFKALNNVKTVIGIPLVVKSRIVGIMQVYYEKYYAYSNEQARHLETFAKYAVVAIEATNLISSATLLKESHHRIKNNLQSIVSLIAMQKKSEDTEADKNLNAVLDDIILKVRSIATVHDLLSKDKNRVSLVNLKDIIENIVKYIPFSSQTVEIEFNLQDILIMYNKATSIALIVNELISNCIKHAFSDEDNNKIIITTKKNEDSIFLEIKNNGRNLTETFNINNQKGMGMSIVASILEYEFNGTLDMFSTDNETFVQINIPNKNMFVGIIEREASEHAKKTQDFNSGG